MFASRSGKHSVASGSAGQVTSLMHFNGADTGTIFTDEITRTWSVISSGNAFTSTNNPKFGTAALYVAAGNNGIQTTSALTGFDLTGDFTIEAWLKISVAGTASTYYWVCVNCPDFAGNTGFAFGLAGNDRLSFFAYPTTTAVATGTTSLVAGGGDWYHIAATRQGSTVRLFVNGNLEATGTYSGALNSNGFARIGGGNMAGSMYVDDFRLTKGAALYTTNFTPPTAAFPNPTQTGITYATWNPYDKGAGVTLSNNNTTVAIATTPNDGGGVRSTIGKSSGKWYWEVTVGGSQGYSLTGVATAAANVNSGTYWAATTAGYGYYAATGTKYNGGSIAYGTASSPGTVIGVALDMDSGTLTFYRNGVSMGVAFTGLSGTFYAAEGNNTLNVTLSTTNFGTSPFVYAVPSGYNSGLYEATTVVGSALGTVLGTERFILPGDAANGASVIVDASTAPPLTFTNSGVVNSTAQFTRGTGSLSFNNGYLVSAYSTKAYMGGASSWTFDAYLYFPSLPSTYGIIYACAGPGADWSNAYMHTMYVRSNGKLSMEVANGSGTPANPDNFGTFTFTAGSWQHLAVTYDSSTKTIRTYYNGQLNSTYVATTFSSYTNTPRITFGRTDPITASPTYTSTVYMDRPRLTPSVRWTTNFTPD